MITNININACVDTKDYLIPNNSKTNITVEIYF